MAVQVDATYENGVLKLDGPVPLSEKQRVRVTIHTAASRVQQTQGLIPWPGDPAIIEYFAMSPDLDPGEPT
jgi:predicted DNA-binding antitoxin AbrB/MazE fold protein